MMPLSMKTYLALLWGISVLYAMESDAINTSTTETSSINSIAEPHTPAEISVASPAETTVETKTENVQAPVFNQTHGVPSATTTTTASPTSEAVPVFDLTKSETFPTSTELVSTSKLGSVTKNPVSTSQFPGTAGLSSTTESPAITFSTESPISTNVSTTKGSTTDVSTTDVSTTEVSTTNVSTTNVSTTEVSTTNVSTTNVSTTEVSTTNVSTTDVSTTDVSTTDVSTTDVSTTEVSTTEVSTTDISTSPKGILIPCEPKTLPVPTTKSTPVTTTAPRDVSKCPPNTEVQPCSNRHAEKRCLIAIAFLAALATGFMVSTIILCTKLSKRKYKVKKSQPATEMMCISALLPERNITYSRQRNPVPNGVLVIHDDADSDEDGGDNLTLTSFLPENDRFV